MSAPHRASITPQLAAAPSTQCALMSRRRRSSRRNWAICANSGDPGVGDRLEIGTAIGLPLAHSQKFTDFLDAEPEIAEPTDE
jgi:hypothetical protein